MKDGFYLGASISGHQVNGGQYDQWTPWEEKQAQQSATTAERRLGWLPNWPKIKHQATSPDNYRSGRGIEHRRHYKEDFELLKQLGLNTLRFSIEWADLEPTEGQWDGGAVEHYHEYFAELKRQGITPFVTLWHWTHPRWFETKGGFSRRSNIKYFERFVTKVMEEFGDNFRYMTALNEPSTYVGMTMGSSPWPNHISVPWNGYFLYRNLLHAHKRIYEITKNIRPDVQVGISFILSSIKPLRPRNPLDTLSARIASWVTNWWFLNRIQRHLDFLGVSFYFTGYVKNFGQHNPAEPLSDMGWYMEPSALGEMLGEAWRRYQKRIIVSENGLADAQDQYRQWWIEESLKAVRQTRDNGADVFGYLHWSLLDNFEWAYGWWPKFGLIEVDRSKPIMPRIIKNSAPSLAKTYEKIFR